MQKQKAGTAKIIYMPLKKQGQHLHLSCSLIFLLSFVSHSRNIEWLSSAFEKAFLYLLQQFPYSSKCMKHFYIQEAVDTMVRSSYFTRGHAVNKTTILHMLTMTAQPCSHNTQLIWFWNQCMECIKDCVYAHASVRSIQLFLSIQQ